MPGPAIIGAESPKHFVMFLVPLWVAFIILNTIIFKTIITTANLIFIALIIITILVYFLGKKYFENRK